ncbi:unnamed protein product [Gordionus sp. m RMFG-2023]
MLPPSVINSDSFDYKCTCSTHYKLDPRDNSTCLPPDTFLLLTHRSWISRIVLEPNEPLDMILPTNNILNDEFHKKLNTEEENINSIAYDLRDSKVLWVQARSIWRKKDNFLGETEMLLPISGFVNVSSMVRHSATQMNSVDTPIYSPRDIVINSVTRQFFWSCLVTHSIMASWLDDGSLIGAILSGPDIFPMALTIDSQSSHIFWINSPNYHSHSHHPMTIERAVSDGTRRTTIVIAGRSAQFEALHYDSITDKLYWSDPRRLRLESSDSFGGNRQVLVGDSAPRGIATTLNGQLFCLEQNPPRIERRTQDNARVKMFSESLFGVTALHDSTRILALDGSPIALAQLKSVILKHPCSYVNYNGNCSDLCTATHDFSHSTLISSAHCSCPLRKVFRLTNDTAASNMPRRVCEPEPASCPLDEWRCLAGRVDCVPRSWICDGTPDCRDASDEVNCINIRNGKSYSFAFTSAFDCSLYGGLKSDLFKCLMRGNRVGEANLCVKVRARCDNIADCPDASDEANCGNKGDFSLFIRDRKGSSKERAEKRPTHDNTSSSKRPPSSAQSEKRYAISFIGALSLLLLFAMIYASLKHKCADRDNLTYPHMPDIFNHAKTTRNQTGGIANNTLETTLDHINNQNNNNNPENHSLLGSLSQNLMRRVSHYDSHYSAPKIISGYNDDGLDNTRPIGSVNTFFYDDTSNWLFLYFYAIPT